MSTGHALITRQTIMAAAVETVAGTAIAAASLVTGDTAFNAFDVAIEPDDQPNERESQASLSWMPSVPGIGTCNVKLTTELSNSGSATAPLWFSRLLLAAGFGISGSTATPLSGSSTATTLTIGHNIDGVLERASGVSFDWEWIFEAGKIIKQNWTGKGGYEDPTDTAMLALTGVTANPPKFQGATVTFGGTSYPMPSFTMKGGNDVQFREDGTAATGIKCTEVVNRKIAYEFMIEKSLIATQDWPGIAKLGTEVAFSAAVGSGTNGIVTIASAKLQLRSRPKRTTKNGIEYWSITAGANRNAAAGDDELSIVLS
jgi:hypothetical protein